jgi:hypothetical protein
MFYVEVFAKEAETQEDSIRFTYDVEAVTKEEAEVKARELHSVNVLFPIIESVVVLSKNG